MYIILTFVRIITIYMLKRSISRLSISHLNKTDFPRNFPEKSFSHLNEEVNCGSIFYL